MSSLPDRYFVDPETNLALNTPNQWSHSPYLGAVLKEQSPNYIASIHIPMEIWTKLVAQNHQKWKNAPVGFLHANITPITIYGFKDPRQAAWLMQEVLYSDNIDTEEVIEDYLEHQYCGGLGDLWQEVLDSVPEFEGAPISTSDEKKYFEKFDVETRKKIMIKRKNTEMYETNMRKKIQRELDRLSLDVYIDNYGLEYFLTRYGSVELKDFSTLTFGQMIV